MHSLTLDCFSLGPRWMSMLFSKLCEFFFATVTLCAIFNSGIVLAHTAHTYYTRDFSHIDREAMRNSNYSADHEFHFEADLPRWDTFYAYTTMLKLGSLLLTSFSFLLIFFVHSLVGSSLFCSSVEAHILWSARDTFYFNSFTWTRTVLLMVWPHSILRICYAKYLVE